MNTVLASLGFLLTVIGALAVGVVCARVVIAAMFALIQVHPRSPQPDLRPTAYPASGD